MFLATSMRRVTALVIVLALAAPAWTVCRTVASAEAMAGMPCCHDDGAMASGSLGSDCCAVQQEDPAGAPEAPGTAPTLRVSSPALAVLDLPIAAAAARASHERRAEADNRTRPHTAPHLLDSVLLI